jgi:hypothetical protein
MTSDEVDALKMNDEKSSNRKVSQRRSPLCLPTQTREQRTTKEGEGVRRGLEGREPRAGAGRVVITSGSTVSALGRDGARYSWKTPSPGGRMRKTHRVQSPKRVRCHFQGRLACSYPYLIPCPWDHDGSPSQGLRQLRGKAGQAGDRTSSQDCLDSR